MTERQFPQFTAVVKCWNVAKPQFSTMPSKWTIYWELGVLDGIKCIWWRSVFLKQFDKMSHPRQWANPYCLKHACAQRTVIYGVVIVSRNLERANENDGFKMTALETVINRYLTWLKRVQLSLSLYMYSAYVVLIFHRTVNCTTPNLLPSYFYWYLEYGTMTDTRTDC